MLEKDNFKDIYAASNSINLIPVAPEDIPEYVYHVSNPYFRDSISKSGIKPSVGDSYKLHWEDRLPADKLPPLVFLCCTDSYDSSYDDDRYRIHTTNLNKNDFVYDPDVNLGATEWICYKGNIPLDSIELIYEGSGESNI